MWLSNLSGCKSAESKLTKDVNFKSQALFKITALLRKYEIFIFERKVDRKFKKLVKL